MSAPTVLNPATGQWCHGPAIADPTSGSTVDTQARAAASAILAALRNASVIAGATRQTSGYAWNAATNEIVLGVPVAAASGGTTIDTQVRAAIGSITGVLAAVGIVGGATHGPSFVFDGDTNQWAGAAIPDITGGTVVDDVCRTALNSALAAMRNAELIA